MTVFCPCRDGAPVDLDPALKYGPVEFVNDRFVFADETVGDLNELPPAFLNNMAGAVERFAPETDYLLICPGDHLQYVALAAMLGYAYDWFQVLRWDRRERAYYPVTIRFRT